TALALRSGQIDVTSTVTDPRSFAAAAGPDVTVGTLPGCTLGVFAMNTAVAPWSDVHVRRAMAYVINRPDIIQASYPGAATPTETIVNPLQLRAIGASKATVDKIMKSIPKYPTSVAKAKAELAKSAYPNGFTATLTTSPTSNYNLISQVIA